MKRLYFLIFFFSLTSIIAQNDTDEVSQYFDDEGISSGKNIVKLNLASLVTGDLSIQYERVIGNRFSIELGAGLLMPFYVNEWPKSKIDSNNISIENPKGGYSLRIIPKFSLYGEAPESGTAGFGYRKRHYILSDSKTITFNDYYLMFGWQMAIYQKWYIDFQIGAGYRYFYSNSLENDIDKKMIMPLSLSIGYSF